MIYGGCLDQEQSAYDSLKESWAALPSQTQTWGDEVAKSTDGGSLCVPKIRFGVDAASGRRKLAS
jgi:hypothetical protein